MILRAISTGLCISFGLTTCATASKQREIISYKQIEQIPLGTPTQTVLKTLGKPNEVSKTNDGEDWLYDNPKGDMQRAALGFSKGKLNGKLIVLYESDPESNFKLLIKSKFPNKKFISIGFPQCGMDYVSSRKIYADLTNGVSIAYYENQNSAESVSWINPNQLKENISDIQNCKGRAHGPK